MKKSRFLELREDGIPQELKKYVQFVCWKGKWDGRKWTKIPYDPKSNKLKAKTNEPNTWSKFTTAWETYENKGFDGIGIVLTESDQIVGIDIDHCVKKGEINQKAMDIINITNSYTEFSPSGEGIRIFIKGTLPKGWRKKGNFEIYSEGRYLTITGQRIEGSSDKIESRSNEIIKVRDIIEDKELLDQAFKSKNGQKVKRLFEGKWEGDHPSQSEADAALCFHLSFWFEKDPEAIDRVFRSSGLYRPKWEERHYSDGRTYGQAIIDEAVKKVNPANKRKQIIISECINASDLLLKDFPEPKWAIPDILPEGLNMLGGKPKYGKSIFALNVGLAIASGGKALGQIDVTQGSVIYLALEDTWRRLQERILKNLQGTKAPEKLYLYTKFPRMGQGGLSLLKGELTKYSDLRLVIIDVLFRFRPMNKGRKSNMYEADYEEISVIKDLADKYSISILIIHHLRKADAEDVMDTFSGTLGLTGAADGLLAMIRKSGRTELHITGRDIEECAFVLEFSRHIMSWNLLGKADELQSTQKRQRIVDAVSKHGPISPAKIAKDTGLDIQYIKNTLPTLMSDGFIIKKERGVYDTVF